jgi:hypothetical protein
MSAAASETFFLHPHREIDDESTLVGFREFEKVEDFLRRGGPSRRWKGRAADR